MSKKYKERSLIERSMRKAPCRAAMAMHYGRMRETSGLFLPMEEGSPQMERERILSGFLFVPLAQMKSKR